ncbi:hypothetical protein [Frigoriglobus tundricola]|uniref:Uncharacterized protein n=1 Tax=Frigoriglobus tundricola TaxID=2774151 RepID=A0A6M5YSN0_9BACT|nr:hypothetical protein [Frigoriglobus tundricola]QJW96416.1 hypothetical protein FTUN_3973 [Frigoriglobus tundricola]
MTRHAREAVSLAVATALGEAALYALVITDWSQVGGMVLVFAFLIGPPLFVALLAWRRRTHPVRSRVLFGLAVVIAVGGLSVLGFDLYRFGTDPQFRQTPNMHGLIVPMVQWGAIGVVWFWLVVQEAREKRAANKPGQPPVALK